MTSVVTQPQSALRVWVGLLVGLGCLAVAFVVFTLSLEEKGGLIYPNRVVGNYPVAALGVLVLLAAPFAMAAVAGPPKRILRGSFGLVAFGVVAVAGSVLGDDILGQNAVAFAAAAAAALFTHRRAWASAGGVVIVAMAVIALARFPASSLVGVGSIPAAVVVGLLARSRAPGSTPLKS